jgi:hypothetical protein
MKKLFLGLYILLQTIPGQAMPPVEEARTEAMLRALEQEVELAFIRNGKEYDARQAAAHLRLKFDRTRSRLDSAEQFIDRAGSSSSLSGEPYLVRKPGEEARPAGPFLHELLKRTAK